MISLRVCPSVDLSVCLSVCWSALCCVVMLPAQRMSVLDKLHAALAEEKRIDGIRAQAEAAVRHSTPFPSERTRTHAHVLPPPVSPPPPSAYMHGARGMQRPKPKPKMAFKSNTRRRDYAQESLLASEHSPRMGADGSPILKVRANAHRTPFFHLSRARSPTTARRPDVACAPRGCRRRSRRGAGKRRRSGE
jgi:hypothetical protein